MTETLYTKWSSLKKAGVCAPGPIGTAGGAIYEGFLFQHGWQQQRENRMVACSVRKHLFLLVAEFYGFSNTNTMCTHALSIRFLPCVGIGDADGQLGCSFHTGFVDL